MSRPFTFGAADQMAGLPATSLPNWSPGMPDTVAPKTSTEPGSPHIEVAAPSLRVAGLAACVSSPPQGRVFPHAVTLIWHLGVESSRKAEGT